MGKVKKAFIALLCLLFSCSVFIGCGETEESAKPTYELPHYDYADGDNTMCNTDLFYVNSQQATMGDPEIISVEEDGELVFYAVGTNTGREFRMWRSVNLTNWENVGIVYQPDENSFVDCDHWAPNLIYDATADWQYYLGQDAGEGKGLYCMFFSGRDNDHPKKNTQLQAAFSKKVTGPYTTFKGINANGDWCDSSTYHFDVEKLKGLGLYADHVYGDLYKEHRRFLDSFPFVDPVSGDKYLYFCRGGHDSVDKYNEIWGVKMKDWVSPDYPTTTPLTTHGYTTIDKTERLNWPVNESMGIDEGPAMVYKDFTDDDIDNGTYYLTCSLHSAMPFKDKYYAPIQSLGSSPLGKFEKVQPEKGGFLAVPEEEWDVIASGHHDMIYIGDELWNVYHNYKLIDGIYYSGRYLACDKVEWAVNADGKIIMYTNGPSKTPQPLPEAISGYKNIAPNATIATTSDASADIKLLTDKLIPMAGQNHIVSEFVTENNSVTVTLTFDDWVTARAILIYNSTSYETMFTSVEKIEFVTKNGTAYIQNLGVDANSALVPQEYLQSSPYLDLPEGTQIIRPVVASIAEFDEVEISKVTITINKADGKSALGIGEIMILGLGK